MHPGIILDFNEQNEIVGVEALRVKNRIPLANLKQMQFEVAKKIQVLERALAVANTDTAHCIHHISANK